LLSLFMITRYAYGPVGRMGFGESWHALTESWLRHPGREYRIRKHARGAAEGVPTEGTTEELGIDELLDYEPVPPRLVTRISLRYQRLGRGRPLPYLLDEVGPE
jgi:hypothetical protein